MDGIRTRWLHIVKFLLIFSFFFVISLPLPFSRLRPRRRSPWSSAAIRFLFFLLHPSSSLAKEGGASGCRHGPWPLVLGWGGVGGSGSKLFQVPRAAPSVFTCVVLNKPALLRAVEPPRAEPSPRPGLCIQPGDSVGPSGYGSCLQRHLLLSFWKLLSHFILIPTSDCCSVWGFGPCVLRSASSPAPTSPSWSDYVDNNV